MSTKETLILYWLSLYKPDKWSVRYLIDHIIYTALKKRQIVYIQYFFISVPDEDDCVAKIDEYEYRGTVEECLKKLKAHVET